MKRLLTIAGMLLTFMYAQSQSRVEVKEEKKKEIIELITDSITQVSFLHCSFVQTKYTKMLSNGSETRGIMDYIAPDKLSWAYCTPKAYTIKIDGAHVVMTGSDATEVNPFVKAMSKLILGCVNGKHIFDERLFSYKLFEDNGLYCVLLIPIRKDMHRIFKEIVFYFDKERLIAKSISLNEHSGDNTIIRFENINVKK